MDSMAIEQGKHAGLFRLSTSNVMGRRDSLSSSRTRDSGYNSDLDALSPLDFAGCKQDDLMGPLPVQRLGVDRQPPMIREIHDFKDVSQNQTPYITSSVSAWSTTVGQRWPSAILPDLPESAGACSPQSVWEDGTAAQDECMEKWIRENMPLHSREKARIPSITSISSTSSSELYTNTDASEDDQERCPSVRPKAGTRPTKKLVECILRKVDVSLRQEAYKQCASRTTAACQNAANLGSPRGQPTTSQLAGNKRKYRAEGGSPPPPDEDEDEENKRHGRNPAAATSDESSTTASVTRFACPFYKHDPARYRYRKTCPGPGWPTVHRMKEHLYRSHTQPIFCPICYETFKSDRDQSDHVRRQQCRRAAPQQLEGMDRETVLTLRRRSTALRLEEDKWRDVYQVLFPDVLLSDIPSPFYACDDSPSESSRRFRRELLRRVQEELFATAEQTPGHAEQQLLHQVARILRNCEHDLLGRRSSGPAEEEEGEEGEGEEQEYDGDVNDNDGHLDRRGSAASTLSMFSDASSAGGRAPPAPAPANPMFMSLNMPMYLPQQQQQQQQPSHPPPFHPLDPHTLSTLIPLAIQEGGGGAEEQPCAPLPQPRHIPPQSAAASASAPAPAPTPAPAPPEPAVDITPTIWSDDQAYTAFSLGIDWDQVFPAHGSWGWG